MLQQVSQFSQNYMDRFAYIQLREIVKTQIVIKNYLNKQIDYNNNTRNN